VAVLSDDELNIECDICFDDIIASNKYFLDNNPVWQRRIRKTRVIGFPLAIASFRQHPALVLGMGLPAVFGDASG
jgi:hypothetical protein